MTDPARTRDLPVVLVHGIRTSATMWRAQVLALEAAGRMVRAALSPQAQADVGAGGFALRVMSEALDAVGVLDPLTALERSSCPVWLVNGAWDHFRTQERAYLRAAGRSGQPVRRVVVPRARHLVSLDAPVAFSRVVLEALDTVDPRRR